MEVSQAIWLTMVFGDALLISPKRFDEIILDFYQDAGIWIVIASCVAEYLLLLTYIGVAAYDFFKNRKMMKKMNVQRRTYEFLKFDESHRDVGNRPARLLKAGGQASLTVRSGREEPHPVGFQKPSRPLGPRGVEPRWRSKRNNNTPNNPQLLKFDGDSRDAVKKASEGVLDPQARRSRRMNKSLKRKQIE